MDEEKGLLAMHREMLVEVNEVIMKQHNVAIEQVTARQHSAHGLVERRMMVFGEQMGKLDIRQANVTKTEASNYMRIIAARLNAKPYGIRFIAKSDIGPLNSAQDLPMEVISPNHWKISHRTKSPNAAFVHLPGSLKDHQLEVSTQLKMLADFYDNKMLPSLLLDVDRKRTVTDTPLMINSIVMFWPTGNDSTKPKWSQPKFARVIALETGTDGRQRKAKISYTNADQLKIDANGQLTGGPTHESSRSIDQLIPIDDASQIRSVQTMLEKAHLTATKPDSNHPAFPPPFQHIINSVPTELRNDEEVEGNNEDQNKADLIEEDIDTTDDEDEKEASKDPTYKYRATIDNNNRRVTRSNKNPATPHCSLITNTTNSS